MIPDSVVEEVRARADIVGIIGEFVQLKKTGKDYVGLSPFKDERTPSFFVIPAKGFFHDFSSDQSGDVFAFLMKHQGMEFADAVKHVGARSGVEVREVRRDSAAEDLRRPYYEAVAFAREFYAERLWEWEGGRRAREYLAGRGIAREAGESFGLGFAPDGWSAFRDAAVRHGLEESVLLDLGLVKRRAAPDGERADQEPRASGAASGGGAGGRPYDALRNRVVFPIESVSGRTLAFGGRLLGKSGKGAPKYLNSPESPIFDKGSELYGLSWARNHIRREGEALLVEGFMDAVSLAARGIRNAVATLGTALTERHAVLLRTYTAQTRVVFDSDPAGLRATFRAADILLARGMQVSVVTLPDGEDPDSVARARGADGVRAYLAQAVDVLERKIAILEERGFFDTIEGARTALDRLFPTLRAVADPQLRDLYLDRVARRTGVRLETLEKQLASGGAPRAPRRRTPVRASPSPEPRFHGLGPERQLISLLLRNRDLLDRACERVGPADFDDPAYRAIFEELIHDPQLAALPEGTSPEVARRFEELMADPEPMDSMDAALDDTVERIRNSVRLRRVRAIDAEMASADPESAPRLLVEKSRLLREMGQRNPDWRFAAQRAARESQGRQTPSHRPSHRQESAHSGGGNRRGI